MTPKALTAIFAQDLLDQEAQLEGFAALLALDGIKPFECVGEADEARAAVLALAQQADWAEHRVVRELNRRLHRQLNDQAIPTLAELCQPGGPHRIPRDLLDAA